MILDLSNILKNKLSLDYSSDGSKTITNLCGLVKVAEILMKDGTTKIKVPYPVSEQTIQDESYLVPSKEKRCIVYFEGNGTSVLSSGEASTQYLSKINLVCHYNAKGFTGANIQARLINRFTALVKSCVIHEPYLSIKEILISGISENSPSIFSKYSYSDFHSQFLGYPFGYFQIDFAIKISSDEKNCTIPIIGVIANFNDCQ